MIKTATPAKAIDCDRIHGPRRKVAKRFEVWQRTKLDTHATFRWFGTWMKMRHYEDEQDARNYAAKMSKASGGNRWLYRIIDVETNEVVWESDK